MRKEELGMRNKAWFGNRSMIPGLAFIPNSSLLIPNFPISLPNSSNFHYNCNMRALFFTLILALAVGAGLSAQSGPQGSRVVPNESGDSAIGDRYVRWAEQAIKAGQWIQARNALERAADYADVSSDISYLLALARFNTNEGRGSVLQAVGNAIQVGRWTRYGEPQARLLEAQQLIAMRRYSAALDSLVIFQPVAVETADAAMLRLSALKGLVNSGAASYSAEFRRRMSEAMNRYPRDTRTLRLLFDYANYAYADGRKPNNDDIRIMELALERLPFLLPADPELAWIAAPFINDIEKARQSLADYRDSSLKPNPASLVPALNLGLLDDIDAVEELFALGNPAADSAQPASAFVIDKDVLVNVWKLLRSEEGRNYMSRRLQVFSGAITEDEDHDGFAEIRAVYKHGVLEEYYFDADQDRLEDVAIIFNSGNPQWARMPSLPAVVYWESYPSVQRAVLGSGLYLPAPGGFRFAPLGFIEICASDSTPGLLYPQREPLQQGITRRMLASFAVSVQQPSVEFAGGIEHTYLENGIPVNAEVILNNKIVSFTEFENGRPVTQWLDLDLDGRMETVRRFRRNIFTGMSALNWDDLQGRLSQPDFRQLLESSESDWNGDGKFESGELYREDGSVVNKWRPIN